MRSAKIIFGLAVLAFIPANPAPAAPSGCAAKERALERKLEEARKHDNRGRIGGLEEALSSVRRWCTEEGLVSEAELNVLDKSDEVREREADLAEAERSGKAGKIAKRRQKLEEARAELRRAEQERDAAKAAAGAAD